MHEPNTTPFSIELVKAFNDLPLVRTEATIVSDLTQEELDPGLGIKVLEKKAKRDSGHLIYIGRNLLKDAKVRFNQILKQ